jgi:hypothetical protein
MHQRAINYVRGTIAGKLLMVSFFLALLFQLGISLGIIVKELHLGKTPLAEIIRLGTLFAMLFSGGTFFQS